MIYAFTSAALNYLPKARLCLGSLRRFHPEFRLCYALADRLPPGTTIEEDCVDEVIAVEDLPELAAPGWIFQHSIVELSTGIKGAVLQRLLARDDCEAVLYFDPDIVLFSRLDDLVERLRAANIVLTPHQTKPEATLERIIDNEIGSLKWGIFNLGFLGVRNGPVGSDFADWWAAAAAPLLLRPAGAAGLFTDQKWINHVPSFFDGVDILKEPRFNVATWNITTRELTGEAPDAVTDRRQAAGLLPFHRLRQRRACDHGQPQRRRERDAAGADRLVRAGDRGRPRAIAWRSCPGPSALIPTARRSSAATAASTACARACSGPIPTRSTTRTRSGRGVPVVPGLGEGARGRGVPGAVRRRGRPHVGDGGGEQAAQG